MALGVLVMVELEREASLHREVIALLEANERLATFRGQLTALAHAARLAAVAQAPDAQRALERLGDEVELQLDAMAARPQAGEAFAAFASLSHAARAAVLNARSVPANRASRGPEAAEAAATEAERAGGEAVRRATAAIDAQAARINQRTLAQIRVAETLRRYVGGALAGSALLLAVLAALYRGADRRARLALQRIEELAHFDPVTTLANRSLANERLVQELARASRHDETFALLVFDLDDFKSVNDTWGHAAGDEVLRQAAARGRACLRASDTLARIGGDEFLAILPETTQDGAMAVAEKLRDAIASPFRLAKGDARVGASIGVSLFPRDGREAEALLHAADAALYEGKRRGKNRVVLAGPAERRDPEAALPA